MNRIIRTTMDLLVHSDISKVRKRNYESYVKNFDKERTGNVAGMLLYAKTDESVLLQNSYWMGGNAITVNALDLDCEFEEIKNQLNAIVENIYSSAANRKIET